VPKRPSQRAVPDAVIKDPGPNPVIQQLLNILQAANFQAVKADRYNGDCRQLIISLLLANGATGNGSKSTAHIPHQDCSDYLVYYTSPNGEAAYLTRAQAEVIQDFWPTAKSEKSNKADLVRAQIQPLGCCIDANGNATVNVPPSQCNCPPCQSWCQGPCGPANGG
jgi:hypothetical protein